MKIVDFIRLMDDLDAKGIWVYRLYTLARVTGEAPGTLQRTLSRMGRAGLITKVARGLYVNGRAKSMPADPLPTLASFLRPWGFSYLSLESVLSERGLISQIPSRMTMMTSGREGVFHTPFGTIEFVHTERPLEALSNDLSFDEARGMWVASTERAVADLRRVGRNTDLLLTENEDHAQ